jgi:hypothetical protein
MISTTTRTEVEVNPFPQTQFPLKDLLDVTLEGIWVEVQVEVEFGGVMMAR